MTGCLDTLLCVSPAWGVPVCGGGHLGSRGLCAWRSLSSCLPCSCPAPTPSPHRLAGGAGGQVCPPLQPPFPMPQTQPCPAGGAPLKPRDESLPSPLLLPVAMVMGGIKGGHRPRPLVGTRTLFPDTQRQTYSSAPLSSPPILPAPHRLQPLSSCLLPQSICPGAPSAPWA